MCARAAVLNFLQSRQCDVSPRETSGRWPRSVTLTHLEIKDPRVRMLSVDTNSPQQLVLKPVRLQPSTSLCCWTF